MKAVIDTRFFILSAISDNAAVKKWIKTTLQELQRDQSIGIVPSIVLHELYKFLLQTLGKDVAEIYTDSILKSNLQVINLDPSIAIEAAKLRCKYSDLPTADAIIAATAIKTSSNCVLTDDKHIKQIAETKTKWLQQT